MILESDWLEPLFSETNFLTNLFFDITSEGLNIILRVNYH